jgi:hypothetical protein
VPVVRAPFFAAGPREAVVLDEALRHYVRRVQRVDGQSLEPWVAKMLDELGDVAAIGRRGAVAGLAERVDEHERTREHVETFASFTMSTVGVSRVLGTTPRAVQRLAKRGSLPSRRVGRVLWFDPLDVDEYVRNTA